MQEAVLNEASSTPSMDATPERRPEPAPGKEHPALPALTWQSIAEGLGDIFKGNMVRNPVDISFSNITYTASLGFRKGKFVLFCCTRYLLI